MTNKYTEIEGQGVVDFDAIAKDYAACPTPLKYLISPDISTPSCGSGSLTESLKNNKSPALPSKEKRGFKRKSNSDAQSPTKSSKEKTDSKKKCLFRC